MMGFAAVRGQRQAVPHARQRPGCRMLAGPQAALEPHDWHTQLQALAEAQPQAAARVQPATPLPVPLQALAPVADAPVLPPACPMPRSSTGAGASVFRSWCAPVPRPVPLAALALQRPADDELAPWCCWPRQPPGCPARPPGPLPRGRTLDLFDDTPPAAQGLLLPLAAQAAPWHQFVRGSAAGNFLHQQLEWLAAEGFALEPEGPWPIACAGAASAGHGERAAELSCNGSAPWCTCPAAAGAPLRGLQRLLPEMEFWLPVHRLRAAEVDALCRTHLLPGRERPALPERELRGMLMGFADLVSEQGGRYSRWTTSNHLSATAARPTPQTEA